MNTTSKGPNKVRFANGIAILEIERLDGTSVFVTVDEADYPLVASHRWYLREGAGGRYVQTNIKVDDRKTTLKIHRLLTGLKGCDHVDRNGLNNVRSNLRFATPKQNVHNRGRQKNNTSGYKGVRLRRGSGGRSIISAQIGLTGKLVHLGNFKSVIAAAHAYDVAAKKYFGEFAVVNFPETRA